jgi:hypothetical protein
MPIPGLNRTLTTATAFRMTQTQLVKQSRSTKPIIHLSNDLVEVKDVVLLGRIFQRVRNVGEVRNRPQRETGLAFVGINFMSSFKIFRMSITDVSCPINSKL